MSEQRITIQSAVEVEGVEAFTKEYFSNDKIIFLDVSMLKVRKLRNVIENNLFFGNTIWISLKAMHTVQELMEKGENNIKTTNANILVHLWEKNKQQFVILDIQTDADLDFLEEHQEVILYTSSKKKQELARKRKIHVRLYSIYNGADKYNTKKFDFQTLGCMQMDEELNMYYILKEDTLSRKETKKIVYNKESMGNVEYLIKNNEERQYIGIGDLVIIKVKKDKVITFMVYLMVNNHRKHNVVKLLWTDVPIQGEYNWSYVPKELIPFIKAEL